MKRLGIGLVSVMCCLSTVFGAGLEDQLMGRIEKLEKLKIVSWLDMAYYGNTKANNVNGFDQHHVYFTVDNEVSDKLRGLFTVEYEHGVEMKSGTTRGEFKMDSAWMSYSLDQQTNFKFGRFFNPIGFWLPAHWAILMETVEKPLLTKHSYLPLRLDGVGYYGSMFIGDMDVSYSAALANGIDMSSVTSALDKNNAKALILDGRVSLQDGTVGVGYYLDEGPTTTYAGVLLYGKYTAVPKLNIRSEALWLDRSGSKNVRNLYVNANYDLNDQWMATTRVDWTFDALNYSTGDNSKTMYTYALRYKPEPNVVFRAEISNHVEPTTTYTSYGLLTMLLF